MNFQTVEALAILASVLAFCGVVVWAFGQSEYKRGAADAKREQEKADAEALKRASEEVARHRTVDDTADKLRDGRF